MGSPQTRESILRHQREKVDGEYKTTLNGFYFIDTEEGWNQTRLIISFGKPYSLGENYDQITQVTPQKGAIIKTIVEEPYSATSGYSSYVVLLGNGINIEIYDQSEQIKRAFTESAIDSVNAEIRTALQHREAIRNHGKVPLPELYPEQVVNEEALVVKDGMQPGIFLVEAWLNPLESGELYLKVFNTSTGERLSEERITQRSTRLVSWSDDPKTLFPYNSEITVYEGDGEQKYQARFELWHKNSQAEEKKLIEATRIINSWQR